MSAFPANETEGALAGMLFDKATELYPDWPLGDRTDLAMEMFAVVKQWAHKSDLITKNIEL